MVELEKQCAKAEVEREHQRNGWQVEAKKQKACDGEIAALKEKQIERLNDEIKQEKGLTKALQLSAEDDNTKRSQLAFDLPTK